MGKDLVDILPDYSEKVGNLNASVLAARDAESAGYAHYMAKMLAASDAQRKENRKLQEIRKKRYGIDPLAQQPSTQAIMARPKEKDLDHFLRPLVDCQVRDKDGNIDVGARPTTPQEIAVEEKRRRGSKNSVGQSEKSAFGEERKEAAFSAFICSPPATLSSDDEARLTKLVPYGDSIVIAKEQLKPEPQRSLAGKLFHWLWKQGVPVQRTTKKDFEA